MKQMVLRWTAGVIALLITVWVARMLPPVRLDWVPPWHVIIFVPVLAVVNAVIGPIIKLLALPINCLTFGLFSFVINALLFWLAGVATGADMNAWGALFGSVVYAVLCTVVSWPIKESSD
jgi:putative membrane protein